MTFKRDALELDIQGFIDFPEQHSVWAISYQSGLQIILMHWPVIVLAGKQQTVKASSEASRVDASVVFFFL